MAYERRPLGDDDVLLWVLKHLLSDEEVYVRINEHDELVVDGRITLSGTEIDAVRRLIADRP